MTGQFRFRRLIAVPAIIRILSVCAFLCCSLAAVAQDVISTPAVPSGPSSGASGTLYEYIASGSASSQGNPVQYSFNWGDGKSSGWTPNGVTMSFHVWSEPRQLYGHRAGAVRCRFDRLIEHLARTRGDHRR